MRESIRKRIDAILDEDERAGAYDRNPLRRAMDADVARDFDLKLAADMINELYPKVGVDPAAPGEDRTVYGELEFKPDPNWLTMWKDLARRYEAPTVDRVKLYNYRIKGQPDNPEPLSVREYIPKLEFTEPRWIDAPEHYRVLCVPHSVFVKDYRRVNENGQDCAVGEHPVMLVRKDGKRFREAAWYPNELVKQYQGEIFVILEEM